MKKYFIYSLIVSICPSLCFGASIRYNQLVREKQRKLEELEKCLGTTNGLKIAGISTLGLTAVGVSTDIAQAKTKSEYDNKIGKIDRKIETAKQDFIDKKAKIEKKKADAAEQDRKNHTLRNVVASDIEKINKLDGKIGDTAVLHGYNTNELPGDLGNKVESSIKEFEGRCEVVSNKTGVKKAGTESSVSNCRIANVLTEDSVLSDLKECEVYKCIAEECDDETHVLKGGTCNQKDKDCTDEAKKKDMYATSAEKNSDGKCQIKSCEYGYKPKNNKCEQIQNENTKTVTNTVKSNEDKSKKTDTEIVENACKKALTGLVGIEYVSKSARLEKDNDPKLVYDEYICTGYRKSTGNYFGTDEGGDCAGSLFTGLAPTSWKVEFDYSNNISGDSRCEGSTCYCRITQHNIGDCSRDKYKFVESHSEANEHNCKYDCAFECADKIYSDEDFRYKMFNVVDD